MRRRDGLSWGRIATITGLPSSSVRRICTWDLEEIAPTAFVVAKTCGRRSHSRLAWMKWYTT